MARKQFINNYQAVFAIAVLFGLILIVLAMDKGSCPEPEVVTEYVDKECPVKECEDVVCEECICPACPDAEIRYVCPDGSTAAEPEMCDIEADTSFDPVKTNEEGTLIEYVTPKRACIYGRKGGAVSYKVGSIASIINFQVKESVDEEFETIYTEENKYEGNTEFTITDGSETFTQGDFELRQDKVYLFRMEFFFPGHDSYAFSNEHIIDTTEGSEYMSTKCS